MFIPQGKVILSHEGV